MHQATPTVVRCLTAANALTVIPSGFADLGGGEVTRQPSSMGCVTNHSVAVAAIVTSTCYFSPGASDCPRADYTNFFARVEARPVERCRRRWECRIRFLRPAATRHRRNARALASGVDATRSHLKTMILRVTDRLGLRVELASPVVLQGYRAGHR